MTERAFEIDNSDMEEPDHAAYSRARWQLNSFANFDRLADQDFLIGYPTLPKADDDPGPVSSLLIILRGRLRAAEYGEDASIDDPQVLPR